MSLIRLVSSVSIHTWQGWALSPSIITSAQSQGDHLGVIKLSHPGSTFGWSMEETEPRQTDVWAQRKPSWQYHPSLNKSKPNLSPLLFSLYVTDEAVPPPSPLLPLYLRVFCWILNITTGPLLDIYLQGYLVLFIYLLCVKRGRGLQHTQNIPIEVCPCWEQTQMLVGRPRSFVPATPWSNSKSNFS